MIDFHIIHREEPSKYLPEALASLEGQKVTVKGSVFRIGEGRLEMFEAATLDYVSYCDDDDLVHGIPVVERFLTENKPKALFTNSWVQDQDKGTKRKKLEDDYKWSFIDQVQNPTNVHQLIVVERKLAIECAREALKAMRVQQWRGQFDSAFRFEVARRTEWSYLPSLCYTWRIWDAAAQDHTKSTNDLASMCVYYRRFAN